MKTHPVRTMLPLLALLVAGACSAPPKKPGDLAELRVFLLKKAKQKFKHALRITERHSPDPFNQARQQLVYTLIELEEYDEAERMGREFLKQKKEYLDAARSRLAEVELDWKTDVAGNPKIKGTRKETAFLEKQGLAEGRIRLAEGQIITLSLLLGEVFLHTRNFTRAIPIFKEILEVRADHNTALRRIGQAYALLGDHNLGAMYLELAHKGIEGRIGEIREEITGPEEKPPAEENLAEVRLLLTPADQVRSLERAGSELAAVIGLLHHLTGDFPKAGEWFALAFEKDPASRYVELKLALVLLREGRPEAAAKHLEKFRASFKENEGSVIRSLIDRLDKKSPK